MSHNEMPTQLADLDVILQAVKRKLLHPGGSTVRLNTIAGECQISSEIRSTGEISVLLYISGSLRHWMGTIRCLDNGKGDISHPDAISELDLVKRLVGQILVKANPKTTKDP